MEINIQCQRCGACCRWPGEVRLDDSEVAKLAAFLGLSEKDFIEQHTRLRKDRRGLALKTREDHSCIFLDGNACLVQPVKPQQCKEFPNRWVNLLWGKVPVEAMRRDYPMLFACSAFKDFLKSHRET
jgi:Fe-S-cluster containining protein